MMTKRLLLVVMGLALAMFVSTAQAGMIEFDLVAQTSGSSPGITVSTDGHNVTVPVGSSGYVRMALYASILGTDAIFSNDKFAGSAIEIASLTQSGGWTKLHGDFGPQLPPLGANGADPINLNRLTTNGGYGVGPYMNVLNTFKSSGFSYGDASDLNNDGDLDWGHTPDITPGTFQPSSGLAAATARPATVLVGGRSRVQIGTVYYNYGGYNITADINDGNDNIDTFNLVGTAPPSTNGSAAVIHAWSLPVSGKTTYYVVDGGGPAAAGIEGNSTTIGSTTMTPNPGFDVVITSGTVVPEPGTFVLLGAGLVVLPLVWRRRRA